jgi:hypothetical protein
METTEIKIKIDNNLVLLSMPEHDYQELIKLMGEDQVYSNTIFRLVPPK